MRRQSDSHEVNQRVINEEDDEDEESSGGESGRNLGLGMLKSVRVNSDLNFNHD